MTTLPIGAPPITKTADQVRAERRDRAARRAQVIANIGDAAVVARSVVLTLLVFYIAFGIGPFAGAFLLTIGSPR